VEDAHIIGHSLGAHLAGFVGDFISTNTSRVRRQIGRISGLDPASPHFSPLEYPRNARLDDGDAVFVDVIHTDVARPLMDHEGSTIPNY
jgi:hypothetical protein